MIRIYQAGNNAEADVIVSALTAHDIPATIQGYNHRSLLGFMGPYIQLNVMVAKENEDEARRLIEELKLENADVGDRTPAALSKRSKMVAVFFALILPGMGSVYLGRKFLGITLVSVAAGLLLLIFLDGSDRFFNYAGMGLIAVVLCDLVSAAVFWIREKEPL